MVAKYGSFKRRFGDSVPTLGGRPVDFSSVYAIGPKEGMPIKIGYGGDPKNRVSNCQAGNWVELFLHYNVWTVDNKLSRRVGKACHDVLDKAKKRLRGEWFNINPEWAKKVIWFAAQEEGIPLYTNKDINDTSMVKGDLMMLQMLDEAGLIAGGKIM